MKNQLQALVVTAALLAVAGAWPARAQAPDPVPSPHGTPDGRAPNAIPEPPAELPKVQHGDPRNNIDKLFEALKVAPTDDSAKFIENRIWALWVAAGGDTATLLMSRVKTAMDSKDYDLAIKLLNAIVDIRPNYVEAWNRRATVYYMKKDFSHALEDLHEVLKLEPRHFGALSGLGMIFEEIGDDKQALEAFRRALAINPHLDKIPDLVKRLTEKVEGRDI
jgi:tetratricopeptide (TPR) repeat protein